MLQRSKGYFYVDFLCIHFGGGFDALVMAANAGEAVGDLDATGDFGFVEDDVDGRCSIESIALHVGDVVAVQAIGEGEDDFASGLFEG